MATNVPKGSIVQAGGTTVAPDPNDPICEAYEKAIKSWCEGTVGARGEFNDHVFANLNDPALAATRERPIGFIGSARNPSRTPGGVLNLNDLANNGGFGSRVAGRANSVSAQIFNDKVGTTTFSSLRNQMAGATRGRLEGRFRVYHVLCPDAARPNGRPIEIKRPTEGPSHNGQLSHYAAASPDGTVELVNCAACDLECKNWNDDCEGHPQS